MLIYPFPIRVNIKARGEVDINNIQLVFPNPKEGFPQMFEKSENCSELRIYGRKKHNKITKRIKELNVIFSHKNKDQ